MNANGFISIQEPCHQGWENMSVSEKGKFCSSCKKDVHDFSNSSLDEIKLAYLQNKNGLCGHVPVKLLQEQYVEREIQKVHFSYLKKFYLAAILCFGASLFTIDAAKASTFYKVKLSFLNLVVDTKDTIIVKGIVQDKKTREKIPFVNVVAYYADSIVSSATTNIEGEYELKIPKEYTVVDVKAIYIGYNGRVFKGVSISPGKNIVVDFDLEQNQDIMLDGIMIMSDEPIINDEPKPEGKTIKKEEYKKMPK